MKEIIKLIRVWDDLEKHRDPASEVEADATVELSVVITDTDGTVLEAADVMLDLTSDHAAELWHKVRQYAEAGSPRPRSAVNGTLVRRQHRVVVAPLEKLCPFRPGTPERRDWLADLRTWAEDQGRVAELHSEGWVPGADPKADSNYHYTKTIILDYMASPGYGLAKAG